MLDFSAADTLLLRFSSQVQKKESCSSEESSFLCEQVGTLVQEKQALVSANQRLQWEVDSLLSENRILRGQIEGAVAPPCLPAPPFLPCPCFHSKATSAGRQVMPSLQQG